MSGDAAPGTGVAHEFEHGPDASRAGQRHALAWALGINAALVVVEVIGGVAFASLALLADAAHLVSDVAALGIALGAVALTARPTSRRHSFGFARAEVMAALVSAVLMLGAGVWILTEAVARLRDPVPVNGAGLAAVAVVGLAVNAGSAVLIHRAQGESLNMRASVAHLATDAAGSLAALLAGLVIWAWTRADAVASLGTAVLVLWAGWGLLRESTHVLMEGTPRGMDPGDVEAAIREIDDVVDVHHLHLWNLASDVPACSAHVVLAGTPTLHQAQRAAGEIKAALHERFALTHVTLELEEASPASPPTESR